MIKHLSIGILLVFSSLCVAERSSQHAHDHRNHTHQIQAHNAHLHGIAELALAIEGNLLEINLTSPSVNIVGFEHKARSKKQINAVEKAKSILESPAELFSLSGGSCTLKHAKTDMSALIDQDGDTHGTDNTTHSEITASYHYECEHGQTPRAVSTNLLNSFTGIETLNVIWLTENRQGSAELTSKSNLIRIR